MVWRHSDFYPVANRSFQNAVGIVGKANMAIFDSDKIIFVLICSKQAESQEEHSSTSYHFG